MKRRDLVKGGAAGAGVATLATLAGCSDSDKAEIEKLKQQLASANGKISDLENSVADAEAKAAVLIQARVRRSMCRLII